MTALHQLRAEVRRFLAELAREPECDSWMRGWDTDFSRALGERGWIGMTVPERYGGGGRSFVERFVITEELLRAGAPVAAHWIADRQIAPTIVAHANERLRSELLPGICRGETYFCVGMSEPNAGSDVAAIATRAERDGREWVISGQKTWTTGAQGAHYCYLIARTSRAERRHEGLSELVVPMQSKGVSVRPIEDLSGERHFNEVFFDDVRVEEWRLVGEPGTAFKQVIRQLDYERSGPERVLSTYPLLEVLLGGSDRTAEMDTELGAIAAEVATLRAMSFRIARQMDDAEPPSACAALVKDRGNLLEQRVARVAVELLEIEPHLSEDDGAATLDRHLWRAVVAAPAFTLRGGSAEILREVVARRMLQLEGWR